MKYRLEYSRTALEDLTELPQVDAQRVVDKLAYYADLESPLSYAKPLSGDFKGSYRFRIGEYRVLFDVADGGVVIILHIITVRHRKIAYR